MPAISLVLRWGYSAFRSTTSRLMAGGSSRRFAGSASKRLSIPSASKRPVLRRSVRSEAASVSRARLAGALGCRFSEQDDGPDQFVAELFGPAREQEQLLPVVSRLDAPPASTPPAHPPVPPPASRERKHATLRGLWLGQARPEVVSAYPHFTFGRPGSTYTPGIL